MTVRKIETLLLILVSLELSQSKFIILVYYTGLLYWLYYTGYISLLYWFIILVLLLYYISLLYWFDCFIKVV